MSLVGAEFSDIALAQEADDSENQNLVAEDANEVECHSENINAQSGEQMQTRNDGCPETSAHQNSLPNALQTTQEDSFQEGEIEANDALTQRRFYLHKKQEGSLTNRNFNRPRHQL